MTAPDEQRWNGNIHYHNLIAEAVGEADSVLDVGCGEGMLARRLRRSASQVTGIDLHEDSIELARAQSGDITYLVADFLGYPFPSKSFDAIVSVATLHHMDAVTALTRMAELLRPGGTLAIVGLARDVFPRDLAYSLAGVVAYRYHRIRKRDWLHPSPIVWPPPVTNREMRRIAEQVLPGARFRRHLLWRYSIVWTKPV
ncbi:class I SAM-dependent methyltransferase [Nocardia acididurans]|nr:class I SAM-dependent methyltransferase [Nocardia acididurans]